MSSRRNQGINFIASQLLWLASVGGAANAMWWLGPLVFVVFAAWQLAPPNRARGDFALMGLALPLGFAVDSAMAASGLLRYASPMPSVHFAPAWILALWMGFALTFNHSLGYVMRRPWLAVALGAFAGPFSYWVAGRSWGAVQFADPLAAGLVWLAALWGVAMGLLAWVTLRIDHPSLPRQTPTGA